MAIQQKELHVIHSSCLREKRNLKIVCKAGSHWRKKTHLFRKNDPLYAT